jgi:hypothetical protein
LSTARELPQHPARLLDLAAHGRQLRSQLFQPHGRDDLDAASGKTDRAARPGNDLDVLFPQQPQRSQGGLAVRPELHLGIDAQDHFRLVVLQPDVLDIADLDSGQAHAGPLLEPGGGIEID